MWANGLSRTREWEAADESNVNKHNNNNSLSLSFSLFAAAANMIIIWCVCILHSNVFFANEEEINEWKIGAHSTAPHRTQYHCIEKLRTSSFRTYSKYMEREWTQRATTTKEEKKWKRKEKTKRNEKLIDGKIAYFVYFMETHCTRAARHGTARHNTAILQWNGLFFLLLLFVRCMISKWG